MTDHYPRKISDTEHEFLTTRTFNCRPEVEIHLPFQAPGRVGDNYSLFIVETCEPTETKEFGKTVNRCSLRAIA